MQLPSEVSTQDLVVWSSESWFSILDKQVASVLYPFVPLVLRGHQDEQRLHGRKRMWEIKSFWEGKAAGRGPAGAGDFAVAEKVSGFLTEIRNG